MSSWIHEQSALFRGVSDEVSAETTLLTKKSALKKRRSALILQLWKIDFSALIKAESALFHIFFFG